MEDEIVWVPYVRDTLPPSHIEYEEEDQVQYDREGEIEWFGDEVWDGLIQEEESHGDEIQGASTPTPAAAPVTIPTRINPARATRPPKGYWAPPPPRKRSATSSTAPRARKTRG